jgi:hypothetical protein
MFISWRPPSFSSVQRSGLVGRVTKLTFFIRSSERKYDFLRLNFYKHATTNVVIRWVHDLKS